jgi:hypothetical protein
MAIAALSPNSLMASPVQVNPKVSNDLQNNVPQTSQDAQKVAKSAKTDTVTISPQALKLADDKNAAARETSKKADEQEAVRSSNDKDKDDAERRVAQRTAEKAYAAVRADR